MRRSAPIRVVAHYPGTGAGRQELARRAAEVHAEYVADAVHRLDCPAWQKLELMQAVLDTVQSACPPGQPGKTKSLPPRR